MHTICIHSGMKRRWPVSRVWGVSNVFHVPSLPSPSISQYIIGWILSHRECPNIQDLNWLTPLLQDRRTDWNLHYWASYIMDILNELLLFIVCPDWPWDVFVVWSVAGPFLLVILPPDCNNQSLVSVESCSHPQSPYFSKSHVYVCIAWNK